MACSLKNKDIIEKIKETDRLTCGKWFEALHVTDAKPSKKAYSNVVDRCYKTYQALNKNLRIEQVFRKS